MSQFTLFPTLPMEIRLQVWRSTFPGPRNVGIKFRFKDTKPGGWVARESTPAAPIALQICHESRTEALKHYALSFGTAIYPSTVYFNYEIDTLCFGDFNDRINLNPHIRLSRYQIGESDYLLNLWFGKSYSPFANDSKAILAGNVRRLVLDVGEDIYGRQRFCWDEVRLFKALEEVIVVASDYEERKEALMGRFRTALDVVIEENPNWAVPNIVVVGTSGVLWGNLKPETDLSM